MKIVLPVMSIVVKYPVLIDFLQRTCKNGVGVEVGVCEADLSELILQTVPCKKLYTVDPWRNFDPDVYPDSINDIPKEDFDKMHKKVVDRLAKYGDRQGVLRMTSVDAAKCFEEESLDFIFIDGNHEYKAVMEDFNAWYPKIKRGGFFLGDDVFNTNLADYGEDGNVLLVHSRNPDGTPKASGKYGVFKALVEFQKLHPGFQFQVAGNHFFSQKV